MGEMITRFVIEMVWLVISLPLYRIAMIRYALTGKKRVFLNLPYNGFLVLRFIKPVVMMWIFGIILTAMFTLMTLIMTSTVVLIPFIPLIILLVYYYSTGYEYGHLAHDIANLGKSTETSSSVGEPIEERA